MERVFDLGNTTGFGDQLDALENAKLPFKVRFLGRNAPEHLIFEATTDDRGRLQRVPNVFIEHIDSCGQQGS